MYRSTPSSFASFAVRTRASQLISQVSLWKSSPLGSFESAARSTTASTPFKCSARIFLESSCTTSILESSASNSLPKKKRSSALTAYPCSSSVATSTVPMYPPAPVTNTFAMCFLFLHSEVLRQIPEPWLLLVLVGENRFAFCYRPANLQIRVVPQHSPVMFRRIIIRHLVNHFCVRFQRAKTMGESRGIQELIPLGCTDDSRHV